jgi:hypothetical protein
MSMKAFGKKALAILRGVAPLAASAIGGPFAGPAMAILSQFTGTDEDHVEDFILSASPEQLLELKKAEIELDRWREEAGIRRDEMEVQDRESARDLAKEKGITVQATLSALYTLGYFGTLYVFISGKAAVSVDMVGMVQTLIGALGAAQLQILNFWFGSSRGSKDKTAALVKAANGG